MGVMRPHGVQHDPYYIPPLQLLAGSLCSLRRCLPRSNYQQNSINEIGQEAGICDGQ